MNSVCQAVDYTGKTVIVTGAAQGSGSGIARRFAEAGADLAITYNTNAAAAAEKVREFEALGVRAAAYKMNQRDNDEIERVVRQIRADFGRIDCLVNNAGIYPHQTVLDMSGKEWDDMLESNTRGVFFVSQSVARVMKEDGRGGAIVNISSINALNPSDTLVHYGASKAAVEMITRGLAHALGQYGIRVNCIAPGLIDAPNLDKNVPGWRESYSERAPLGRVATSTDMGNVCIFLGSPLAGFVTGQIIAVDGGVLLAPCYDWD
ncbi:MAG: glucose 1-dehydrogenase [Oscillospiraceae bacterium]|nr:glucose 1-dehydrogenase [Oscillospiraceae bacterium]